MSIFSTSYSDSDIAQIQQLLENAEKVPRTSVIAIMYLKS